MVELHCSDMEDGTAEEPEMKPLKKQRNGPAGKSIPNIWTGSSPL